MAARAIWRGVIRFAEVRVAVKLYAAVTDRSVHFRLLHDADHAPVRQVLVNPESDAVVTYGEAGRAYPMPEGGLVLLHEDELAAVEPAPSREIRILQFVPPQAIDHRWYVRPYYLAPDEGASAAYAALIDALGQTGMEGVAQWVMRNKEYVGALRLQTGHPMLISLRHAGEVVTLEDLGAPEGPALDKREIGMAQQLMEMLADDFVAADYQDEYRARVEQLIETKRRGGHLRAVPAAKKRPATELRQALESSLKQQRKRA